MSYQERVWAGRSSADWHTLAAPVSPSGGCTGDGAASGAACAAAVDGIETAAQSAAAAAAEDATETAAGAGGSAAAAAREESGSPS